MFILAKLSKLNLYTFFNKFQKRENNNIYFVAAVVH